MPTPSPGSISCNKTPLDPSRKSRQKAPEISLVDLIIRKKKATVFLTIPENATVLEVKQKLAPLIKIRSKDLHLTYHKSVSASYAYVSYGAAAPVPLENDNVLSSYGITANTATVCSPAELHLVAKNWNDELELDQIQAYSEPAPYDFSVQNQPSNQKKAI